MPAKKKTPAKKTTAGRKKKTTGKKTTAKKTTAAKKKTTAAAGSIPKSALIKARKMRKAGKPWPAIRKATGYRATQLRPAMRAAGMDDVLGRSSSGGTKKKTAAKKKTTGKKAVKKKTAAKKTTAKATKKTKKLPKKTKKLNKVGSKVNLKKLSNDEVVDAVVGKKVTFKRNIDDKKPRTFVVKSAKVVKKKSKNFGRVIMLKAGAEGSYSVPVDWIIRIG